MSNMAADGTTGIMALLVVLVRARWKRQALWRLLCDIRDRESQWNPLVAEITR